MEMVPTCNEFLFFSRIPLGDKLEAMINELRVLKHKTSFWWYVCPIKTSLQILPIDTSVGCRKLWIIQSKRALCLSRFYFSCPLIFWIPYPGIFIGLLCPSTFLTLQYKCLAWHTFTEKQLFGSTTVKIFFLLFLWKFLLLWLYFQ